MNWNIKFWLNWNYIFIFLWGNFLSNGYSWQYFDLLCVPLYQLGTLCNGLALKRPLYWVGYKIWGNAKFYTKINFMDQMDSYFYLFCCNNSLFFYELIILEYFSSWLVFGCLVYLHNYITNYIDSLVYNDLFNYLYFYLWHLFYA